MTWLPKRRVVAPVDFSDYAAEGANVALSLVEDPTHLDIVHILPVLSAGEPGITWDVLDDATRCAHAVESLQQRFSEPQFAGVRFSALVGDPGHEIANYAKEAEADLIVLHSHGRTGLKRMLIGSVAERVVRLAHCPVLVLRE
jgi:nucleotide-binding universal stress UspA family protein